MTQTVGLLGATGVYARHLIPRLVAAGFAVRALVRRADAAGVARGCGADIREADIFDAAALRAGLEGCDIGINLATSLPGPSGRGNYEANDRVRREGTPLWIAAAIEAGVPRIVQQSVAMVNAAGEQWANEDTPFTGSSNEVANRAVAAAIAMEESVRRADLDWVILRGGLFYGPGTGFDDDWFARASAGTLRLPGQGEDYVSLVHITDMAAATVRALQRWPSRRALIVADQEPVQWRNLFSYITDLTNASPPSPGGRAGFPSFRVRNSVARELLDWTPFYASYRSGLIR
jgi:nucleoside-diphosphate-sugar epimerase